MLDLPVFFNYNAVLPNSLMPYRASIVKQPPQAMSSSLITVCVNAVRDEAPGIRSYAISRVDGAPLDAYEPGAHIDVTSPSGVTRQYSLCGDPDHLEQHVFAVKREDASRGGSSSLHDHVEVGTHLTIGAPRNLFRLDATATEHILIAAGIGITPLLSMAYRLVRQKALFKLHYFVRDHASAAFLPLLSQPPFANHLALHCGVEPDRVDAEVMGCLVGVDPNAHVYTCGPGAFMDRVVSVAERYVPAESIHLERFAADPAATAAIAPALDSFEVEIVSTGSRVRVNKGVSIVEALASIDILVDTSCGEGICGTCMVDVISGEPEHRDQCLSKAERASGAVICCCVSRSRSPLLVLDL
jgi:ferredoxin-NADP reductase